MDLWIVSCALQGVQVDIVEIMFDQMKKAGYFPYANIVTYYCYVKKLWNPWYDILFKLSTTHIGSKILIRLRNRNVIPVNDEIGHPIAHIISVPNGDHDDSRFAALEALIVSQCILLSEQIGNSFSLLRNVHH